MGSKFSKSSKVDKNQKKWDDLNLEGRSKYSTLPASFRRKTTDPEDEDNVGKTGTLPRKISNLNRNASFSKRVRKSIRSWASQKGLIESGKVKVEETVTPVTPSQDSTKPSSVVLNTEEDKDKVVPVLEKNSDISVVVTDANKVEVEIVNSETKNEDKQEATTEEANVLKDEKQAQGDEDLNNSENVDTKAETTGSIDNDNKDRSSSESDFVMVEKEDLAPLKEAHEEKKENDAEPMLSKEVDPLELQEAADCKEMRLQRSSQRHLPQWRMFNLK